jgi:hypothetical protein
MLPRIVQPPRRDPLAVNSLEEVTPDPDQLVAAFAAVLAIKSGRTKGGRPFYDLRLGDTTRTVAAKIWDDASEAMQLAAQLEVGQPLRLLARADVYQGAVQLNIRRLRLVDPEQPEPGYDPAVLFGDGHRYVGDRLCKSLVVDIETVPAHASDSLPSGVAKAVDRFASRDGVDESLIMSISPMLGQIVSLAFGEGEIDDVGDQEVTVLAVPHPEHPIDDPPPWLLVMSEADLLRSFWTLAAAADVVVTYNGRNFDIPFLVGRSLIHGINARVDLLGSPYALRPHLDLYRVLTGGGRAQGPTGLDVVCWALGVESPKGAMDGSKVADAYAAGDLRAIAEYNRGDIRATTSVFHRIRDQILRYRDNW